MKWVVLFLFIGNTVLLSTTQSVSIEFVQTEEALTSLMKTEIWPRPVGTENGNSYEVYAWDPVIDIEPNLITLRFTIIADFEISGTPFHQEVPMSLALQVNEINLSVSGVTTFLNGISTQINNSSLHSWLKPIVISAYEGLELTVYPQKLLEVINDQIPSSIDLTITDISTTFLDFQEDEMVWTLAIEYEINKPMVAPSIYIDSWIMDIHLETNVAHTLRQIRLSTLLGAVEFDAAPDGLLDPDNVYEYSAYIDGGLANGYYFLFVLTSSETGWLAYRYRFNISHNNWLTPTETSIFLN